jgi:hypothetical protein
VNLGQREEGAMANRYENETYIEWYTRKLGTVHQYSEMTPKQLGKKMTVLQRDLGATLVYLRHDSGSTAGKMMLDLIEPHYDAVVKEIRGRRSDKAA